MRIYIRKSPLALLPAASFIVFVVFILSARIANTNARAAKVEQPSVQYGERERPEYMAISLLMDTQVAHAPRTAPTAFPHIGLQSALEGAAISLTTPAMIARQQAIPCVFDNFVWFKDQEIIDEIRKDLPSFDGSAPEAGDSIDKILGALKRMLKNKKLPSEVEYAYFSGDGYQYRPEHIFSARDAKIPLCKIVFQNSPPQIEKDLQQAAAALINKDYSKVITRSFVEGSAVAIYRKYGHLRAAAHILSAEIDRECKSSVVVKVAAEPGIAYVWDKSVWTGAQAISAQSLDSSIELKPGEVADGLKISTALQAAYIVYQKLGYVDSQIVPKPVFDDANKRITLEVAITEGSQFRMGDFIVKGVAEKDVTLLKERWALKTGAVYDASYLGEFIQKLVADKLIFPDLARLLRTEQKPDRQRLVVDVIIDFKVSQS
jgi:Surface antigen variable number repeat